MSECTMTLYQSKEDLEDGNIYENRCNSVEGSESPLPSLKIPMPPRLWIADCDKESSDEQYSTKGDEATSLDRVRVRSRGRHPKHRGTSIPVGIFWDIENCQVPRGCSAIDVVAAIRAKFLIGRREADFYVVCDVRKESVHRSQELNDAQVSLVHVCGTQKNAADEKLRQCMRRFVELHPVPSSLLLISGDINFAADLSDFKHRKGMEVILVHKQNTSSALITCASSHYCFNELTAHLPRNPKVINCEEYEEPTCEMEIMNLPLGPSKERISKRLRRLGDNCGGKVLSVTASTALLRFPTPDHACRALKRMDGEDVFGNKISTRYARSALQPTYSSDEGYSTAASANSRPTYESAPQPSSNVVNPHSGTEKVVSGRSWALALQALPTPTPSPLDFCPPLAPARPRKITGAHSSVNLDQSACSSSNSCDDSRNLSHSRAVSPWNCSSLSGHSEDAEAHADLTVTNLPPYDPKILQTMITRLFTQIVTVIRVSVWASGEGPIATVGLRSEWDARVAIARLHKRRLENHWAGRRLELSLGKPSPAPNLDVLRARLRAILLEQKECALPLLRLRDAYASRHCCALTTSDIAKVKDTVVIQEGYGRIVHLIDHTPVNDAEMEEAPWKCQIHSVISVVPEDGSKILQPVYMELAVLSQHVRVLLETHGGVLPLLSFVECYESVFPTLVVDMRHGVALELLLRSIPVFEVKDSPSRHLTWSTAPTSTSPTHSYHSETLRSCSDRGHARTAPSLEPMLSLFERELVELLRTTPRCSIPFSKLIPAFHHHFGRQCRVADYGFTKLPDLLAALSSTILVLGSGSYRVITISAVAQNRRWTSDIIKILKVQPSRPVPFHEVPHLYQATFGRPFSPVDYGVCTVEDLLEKILPDNVIICPDGTMALPRRSPTPDERAKTAQFSSEAVELLCHSPNLRMEFARFVPAYHSHFGRQLRVAHYGCVKLVDLFELIPDTVTLCCEMNGERSVRLSTRAAKTVMAQRLRAISPVPLSKLTSKYSDQFGAPPTPDILGVDTLEAMVYAAGGFVQDGVVHVVGESLNWAGSALAACAVLSGDRSVARGSSEEYFVTAFKRIRGVEPDLNELSSIGVVETADRCVRLTAVWRTAWRVAQILADRPLPMIAIDIYVEFSRRYGVSFPNAEIGCGAVVEFVRQYSPLFEESSGPKGPQWRLSSGVTMPPRRDLMPAVCQIEDYSVHDTPPGQKGSRVFESPKNSIWCSPPASALPPPTALLSQDRRRTRLAAQFDAV